MSYLSILRSLGQRASANGTKIEDVTTRTKNRAYTRRRFSVFLLPRLFPLRPHLSEIASTRVCACVPQRLMHALGCEEGGGGGGGAQNVYTSPRA